eukprot:1185610-Prorocentrum_minimum.AAC.3
MMWLTTTKDGTPLSGSVAGGAGGGTFREHSGNIQGTFREHSRNIQGTFREHSGNIQGTFKEHYSPAAPRRTRPANLRRWRRTGLQQIHPPGG